MSVIPVPVAGERQSLLEFLRFHHSALLAVSHGLTDEQARSTPTVSSPLHRWAHQAPDRRRIRVDAAGCDGTRTLLDDPWSLVGMMSHREEQHVMREDESLVRTDRRVGRPDRRDNSRLLRYRPRRAHGRARSHPARLRKRALDGALGADEHQRGDGAACRARRHHPRIDRRRNDVPAEAACRGRLMSPDTCRDPLAPGRRRTSAPR